MAPAGRNRDQGALREPPVSWYRIIPFTRRAARLLWFGLAPSTRRSYETTRGQYEEFCALQGFREPYPASIRILGDWAASFADRVQAKTIKRYMSGLKSFHIDIGLSTDAFSSDPLNRILDGVKRLRPQLENEKREPLTREHLLKVLDQLTSSTDDLNLHAAFCLAFNGLLRTGEFTYEANEAGDPEFARWKVTRRSILLHEEFMTLRLPASKTDPFRKGINIHITATGDAACPVKSMRRLLSLGELDAAPLFQARGQAFSRKYVTEALRRSLARCGIQGYYTGYSFRRGGANHALNIGMRHDEVQAMGRWRSDAYKTYLVIDPYHTLELSRRFQQPL